MRSRQVEEYVGLKVSVTYTDRHGSTITTTGVLEAVEYAPLYGASVFVDGTEIAMGRVLRIQPVGQAA